jgi:hypothetical protein
MYRHEQSLSPFCGAARINQSFVELAASAMHEQLALWWPRVNRNIGFEVPLPEGGPPGGRMNSAVKGEGLPRLPSFGAPEPSWAEASRSPSHYVMAFSRGL